jgi:hypothetical protein
LVNLDKLIMLDALAETPDSGAQPMLPPRDVELSLIADYLEDPGATMCPPRFAFRSGALSAHELAARVAAFIPKPGRSTREENQRRWRDLLHLATTAPDVDRSYQLWLTRLPVRLGR